MTKFETLRVTVQLLHPSASTVLYCRKGKARRPERKKNNRPTNGRYPQLEGGWYAQMVSCARFGHGGDFTSSRIPGSHMVLALCRLSPSRGDVGSPSRAMGERKARLGSGVSRVH